MSRVGHITKRIKLKGGNPFKNLSLSRPHFPYSEKFIEILKFLYISVNERLSTMVKC